MPREKRYEAHCPSPSCTGGHQNRLHPIRERPQWLPEEYVMKDGEALYRCNYCGLVWTQKSSNRPGFDAEPIGLYKNSFTFLDQGYRIREENTYGYWDTLRRKKLRRKRKPPL